MSIYLLFTFASFLLYAQAGIYLLLALPRSRVSISFALASWLMAIYALSTFLLQLQHDPERLYLFDRFSTFSVLALAVVFNVFLSFLRHRPVKPIGFAIYYLLLPVAIVLILVNMIDPASIKSFFFKNNYWYFVADRHSVWAQLFVIFSLLCYTLNLIQIYVWHKQSKTNRERIQTRITFTAMFVSLIVILVVEVLMAHVDFLRVPSMFHILGLPLLGTILYTLTNKRFQTLPDEIISGIVMKRLQAFVLFISAKGQVLGANKYSLDVLGYGAIEIQEQVPGALFSNNDVYHQLIRDTSRSVPVYDRYLDLLTKDGTPVRIKVSAVKINDSFNKFVGCVLIGRNYEHLRRLESRIADRKQQERTLDKYHRELEFVFQKRKREILDASVKLDAEINESKQAKRHIIQAIEKKEELVKEMHHRVKNNLQIIISLANFTRLYRIHIDENQDVLKAIVDRLQIISNVHEDFYASPVLSKIAFGEYLRNLAEKIHAQNQSCHNLVFKMDITDEQLPLNQALPCGIIANEVIVNALVHAFKDFYPVEDFPEVASVVGVEFYKSNGLYALNVFDNGVGIPENWRDDASGGSGLHLAEVMANDYLHGSLKVENSFGTRISLIFSGISDIADF